MARVLGVDLGARRIGLAASDPAGILASPLRIVERGRDAVADLEAVLEAAAEIGAARVVVGLPRTLAGEIGPQARAALDEIEALAALAGTRYEILTHDERLSTVSARRSLGTSGSRRRHRSRPVDDLAAAVVLQSWLDAHRD